MTSYRYDISLSDSEFFTLEDALQALEAQIPALNGEAPSWAHRQNIASIREKLAKGAVLRSTNNFFNPLTPLPGEGKG